MTRDDIFAGSPEGSDWAALPAHKRHQWMLRLIERTLAQFDAEGQEPDAWEAGNLDYALHLVFRAMPSAAREFLELVFVPAGGRSPKFQSPVPQASMEQLHISLTRLKALSGFPHYFD